MSAITTHALVGIVSLILGILLGWIIRGSIQEQMKGEDREKKTKGEYFKGLGILLLTAATLVTLILAIDEYRDAAGCQSQYNIKFSEAILSRQEATRQDRAAQIALATATVEMVNAILEIDSTPQKRRAALERYREAYRDYLTDYSKAEEVRADNPFPSQLECSKEISDEER